MLSARRPPARGWGPELASERDERAGEEGSPGARPPPARARPCTLTRTRTLTHARKLTSLPSAPLYFSFLPVPSLARSLTLSLSLSLFSTPPSSPLPPPPAFYYFSPQALSLWVSFDLCSPFLPPSLPSLSLPPQSLLLTSTLPPTAPPSTALLLPPHCARTRTHTHTHSHPSLELRWTERQERKRWRAKGVTNVTEAGAGARTAGPLPPHLPLIYIYSPGPGLRN